jgi:serine/threonine-protein kinase
MGARLSRSESEPATSRTSAPRIASSITAAREGARRVGPFWVGAELARGGMASVHVATVDPDARRSSHTPEPAVFAIKIVLPELIDQADFVEMFLDEARITSLIQHPNVCRVFRYGEADDTLYLSMELLSGTPLGGLRRAAVELARANDPGWHRVVARIAADACAGLHAAHELTDHDGQPLQVVHRDVSPQNVFVCRDGAVKVLDFGIARAEHRLHETNVGIVKGKFAYIAPEQILASGADRRADVWSVGVVLWELLAGRTLFKRPQEYETIGAVLKPQVPFLLGVPDALNEIVQHALCVDPARRPATADAMRVALEDWLAAAGGADRADVALCVERLLPEDPTQSAPRRAVSEPPAELAREARAREATVRLGARPARRVELPTPAPEARSAWRSFGPVLFAILAALAVWSLGRAWQSQHATPADVSVSSSSSPTP